MIDQTSEEGKALQAEVKVELKNYLGKDYNDDVLPLYIVVMLAHGNQQPLVAENLEAFLGNEKAVKFADWLFRHLEANAGRYDPPKQQAEESVIQAVQEAPEQATAAEEGSRKRRREKREKIEWKAEASTKSSRQREKEGVRDKDKEHREEKRRRNSNEREERESRHKSRDRERERARVSEVGRERLGGSSDRRALDVRYDGSRDMHQRSHERDRRIERHSRHRDHDREDDVYLKDPESWDNGHKRRERKRSRERRTDGHRDSDQNARIGSRLAGRLGNSDFTGPRSRSRSPVREEVRGSVHARIDHREPSTEREDGHRSRRPESRSKMRMDSIPAARTELVTEPQDVLPAPPSAKEAPEELAAELRQIRETLAKIQAEKLRRVDTVAASINARKVVLHNVHFNATPDILKAHFSGCGNTVSAIIEKDAVGNPKGVAVVEFEEESSRKTALTLSGSMLLGRPITVYAKESAPAHVPATTFRPRAPTPAFRATLPARGGRTPGRQPGRGFPGRTILKSNKYVRPQAGSQAPAEGGSQAGSAVKAESWTPPRGAGEATYRMDRCPRLQIAAVQQTSDMGV